MQLSNVSDLTRTPMPKPDIGRDFGIFNRKEILEMNRLKMSRGQIYVYLALKLECQDKEWIHTVRFCRDYSLWRSRYVDSLRMLNHCGFINYEQSGDRRSYRIRFLLRGGSHV